MVAPLELGTILFSAVEPHRGREVAYNRWYESDHFYAGCMVGPHCFAGRRFVAPRRLKDLRSPQVSPMCPDRLAASFLAIYWIEARYHQQWSAWAVDRVKGLHDEGRMFAERDHSHTAMYEHRRSVRRDDSTTPIELALDRQFCGLVVTAGDLSKGASFGDIDRWTEEVWAAKAFAASWGPEVIGTSTMLRLPDEAPDVPDMTTVSNRFLQLHFLAHDPSLGWDQGYGQWGQHLQESKLANHVWTAPFVPTVVGTTTYLDELWSTEATT